MRYLGIDYGEKRIGIALSDEEGLMAFPNKVIEWKSEDSFLKEMRNMIKEESVARIVVGLPIDTDGKEKKTAQKVRLFAESLQKEFAMPVYFENELFTTRMASEGVYDKKDIDASAAAIILQSYLDKLNSHKR